MKRLANRNGEFLDDEDVEELIRRRVAGHGAANIARVLWSPGGFDLGQTVVGHHLGGRCRCPEGTPLLNHRGGHGPDS